jgi:hypothetical protein
MNRKVIATVLVAGLTYSIFLVVGGGTPANQVAWLQTDAGITAVTHAATCPVRISPECLDAGRQAGFTLHRYERLRFPVAVRAMADGGRDVQLPPMNVGLAGFCIEVVDWADCTLDGSGAAVTATQGLLGQDLPFTPVGVVAKWVRPKRDAGLTCNRRATDGGTWDFGDRNVYPVAEALDAGDCEVVGSGVIWAGSDEEVDL